MNSRWFAALSLLSSPLFACGAGGGAEHEEFDFGTGDEGDDDHEGTALDAMTAKPGEKARVIAKSGLNLRERPTTSSPVLIAMPRGSEVDVLARSGSWFSVQYQAHIGWAYGAYLEDAETAAITQSSGTSDGDDVAEAMQRAKSGLGFSYHWGGGCWEPGSDAPGACYGSCPSCTHQGKWGADCSGYVAKVWQVPNERSVSQCDHPYNTTTFYTTQIHWKDVPRSSAKRGDAFVRRGHIFIYDSGDAWGSMRAYEAKGCRHGIVYNSRTADSSYKVIRRNGY